MFKSFYEVVRVRIKCRDHSKIHVVRLFEVQDQLYQIKIAVEGPSTTVTIEDGPDDSLHPPNPDDHSEHPEEDRGSAEDHKGNDKMDTDKTNQTDKPPTTGRNNSGR